MKQHDFLNVNNVSGPVNQCGEEPAKESQLTGMLLKSRVVMVTGEVDQELAEDVISKLLVLDAQSHDPIKVIVSSPGGHVDSGYAIHDMMRAASSRDVGLSESPHQLNCLRRAHCDFG